MRVTSWWPRLLRMAYYLGIILINLSIMDRFGHFFVPGHSLIYWAGFGLSFLLLTFWPDLAMTPIARRTLFAIFDDTAFEPVESCKTRGLRWWGQIALVFLMLAVLDRIADGIFSIWHPPTYWLVFLGLMIVTVGWYEFALSMAGQRVLSGALAERTVLVITSLVLTLAAIELFMQTNFSKYHVFGVWPTYAYEPELDLKFNSEGFRDVEHEIEAPPDVTRIVVIGDSVTTGVAVRLSDTYTSQLRELAGDSFEFIVIALPGTNTHAQTQMFIDHGCQYQPDIVIVGVYINDIEREGFDSPYSWVPEPILTRLKSPHSYTPDFFYLFDYYASQVWDALPWSKPPIDPYDQTLPWLELWQADVEGLAEELARCNVEQMYAFTLPVTLFPGDVERHQLITQMFDNAGFETVDLYPEFVEEFGDRPPRSLWALPNDGHPSAEIHRWYAEQIWATMERELATEE